MKMYFVLMILISLIPLIVFAVKAALDNRALLLQDEDGNIRNTDLNSTLDTLEHSVGLLHDRSPLSFDISAEEATDRFLKELPGFNFCGGSWNVVNIDRGTPTTISANLPCIDERDPAQAIRMDLGMLVTIDSSNQGGASIKCRFIPYEGPHERLNEVADLTEDFVRKVLNPARPQVGGFAGLVVAPHVVPPAVEAAASIFPNTFKNEAALEYQQSQSARQAEAAYESFEETVDAAPVSTDAPATAPAVAPPVTSAPIAAAVPENSPAVMPSFDFSVPDLTTPPSFDAAAAFKDQSAVGQAMPEKSGFPEIAPLEPPVMQVFPTTPVLPVTPPLPAVSGSDGQPGLCPGCSQPINPSFPFCLYCSRNF